MAAIVCCITVVASTHAAPKTGTLTGFITDSTTGHPIYGASVIILGKKLGAKTDITGMYHIKKVPLGTYTLRATYIGYTSVTIDSVTVDTNNTTVPYTALKKNPSVDPETTIVISCRNYPIDRLDSGGYDTSPEESIGQKPIKTIDELLAEVKSVVEESKRKVLLRGGDTNEVAYILNPPWFGCSNPLGGLEEQVEAGKALEAVQAINGPTGTITGTIIDSADGTPLVGASIWVVGTELGSRTDSTGEYVIQKVPIGTYTLKVSTLGYVVIDIASIPVAADSTITANSKLQKNSIDISKPFKIKTVPDTADTAK